MSDNGQTAKEAPRSRSLGLFLRPRRFAIEVGSTRSEVARLIAAKLIETIVIDGEEFVPIREVARIRDVAMLPHPAVAGHSRKSQDPDAAGSSAA